VIDAPPEPRRDTHAATLANIEGAFDPLSPSAAKDTILTADEEALAKLAEK
jgi:hypothetical protein